MRLLYVCAYLPAERLSGGSGRMYEVIRRMARRHEVDVLTFYEREDELPALARLESVCRSVTGVRRGQSPEEWRRDLWHQVPRAISFEFGNSRMRTHLAAALNDSRYDLANIEFLQMTYLLPSTRVVPAVLTHHEVLHRVVGQRLKAARWPPRTMLLAAEWMRALSFEIAACRRYERVLAMSDVEANALRRWDRRLRVGISNLGIDCDDFQPQTWEPDVSTIVFVGYFRHTPNVDAVLHFVHCVFPRVRQAVPECRLVLVGGEPPPAIRQLAQDPAVTVTGWVEDVRQYLQRATVVVAPIVSGGGVRMKVIEAWSLGKAVISTSLGAEGLRAEDNVNVWLADDPELFADKVVRGLLRPDLRASLGAAARATAVTHYAWDGILARLEDDYRRAIEG